MDPPLIDTQFIILGARWPQDCKPIPELSVPLLAMIWVATRARGNKFSYLGLSCHSWKWRDRSSVKITERTYEERTQALHC